MKDVLTLTINGRRFEGWTAARVSRGVDRMATDFVLETTQRWTEESQPWRIDVYDPCVIAIDGETLMTGYVDEVAPRLDADTHRIHVVGRSKTQDLIDCRPDVAGGQFAGYSLAAIARTITGLFNIGLFDYSDGLADNTFSTVAIQRSETAFGFLERLGRLSGVLLSDDVNGNLVLTTAGTTRAPGAIRMGQNALSMSARLAGRDRFSQYIVKAQTPIGGGTVGGIDWSGLGGTPAPTPALAPTVNVNAKAVALDAGVPRFRPRVYVAEGALQGAALQTRANWLAARSFGLGTVAEVVLAGWRQQNGALWTPNQIIAVDLPPLGVNQDLLIIQVVFALDQRGRTTELRLAPISAFTPDPGAVKLHKGRHARAGGSVDWTGMGTAR